MLLKFALSDFVELGQALNWVATTLYMAETTPENPLDEGEKSKIKGQLCKLRAHCEVFELPVSADLIDHAIRKPPRTDDELTLLLRAFQSELGSRLFLFVPPGRARFFNHEIEWRPQFPLAATDAGDAGNCYAAALYTASVFHCMRALERGLHSLARDVEMPLGRPLDTQNWASIIEQIEAEIRKRRKAPGATSADPKIRFWSEAAAQFFTFKDAWRNQAMHVREVYTETRARDILDAVNRFMAHLATELTE